MMVNWKHNLAVVWASQFLSFMGFFFAMPFAPFYIQDLGVNDPVHLKMWVALFGAAAPLSLAIFSPIWGALADRYGRRVMLLRANFGAALVLALMGMVHSVEALVTLRLFQGLLSGTVTAAQAMVLSSTPSNRNGTALGALSAAVYSGSMVGTFAGGLFAEHFGYRQAFWASSLLLLAAGLLVLFGSREEFVRPAASAKEPPLPAARLALGGAVPLLLLIVAMAFCRQFDNALFPLLVQEINGGIDGAAFWTGTISAVASVAGFLSAPVFGWLADRFSPVGIGRVSIIGAGLFMIPQGLASGFASLFQARFAMAFCGGGIEPVLQTWLARVTAAERRGAVFGWAATARSIGWVAAPLISGLVASGFGLRAIYFVSAGLYLALLILMGRVAARLARG